MRYRIIYVESLQRPPDIVDADELKSADGWHTFIRRDEFRGKSIDIAEFRAPEGLVAELVEIPDVAWPGSDEEWAEELDIGVRVPPSGDGFLLQSPARHACFVFGAISAQEGRYEPAGTAVVYLVGVLATRFGYPNDEGLPGHPLYTRGLNRAHGVWQVRNSSWNDQLRRQNLIPFPDQSDWITETQHLIFFGKESTFECLVRSFEVRVSDQPWDVIVEDCLDWLYATPWKLPAAQGKMVPNSEPRDPN